MGRIDRINSKIDEGKYVGSAGLALDLLTAWKQNGDDRSLNVVLWEKDEAVRKRIEHYIGERRIAPHLESCVLEGESSPSVFEKAIADLSGDGWTLIWLCDPYFGESKSRDREWFQLLRMTSRAQGRSSFGLVFAFVGGNSNLRGPEKFDYARTIGAPSAPLHRIDENVRSYGLYFTDSAKRLA